MGSYNFVRKSVTIPTEIYEKLITFKNETELFSHFCHRIFEIFIERSRFAKFDRMGVSKKLFCTLIENYPKEKIRELVSSLEASLETSLGKKIEDMDLKREIIPYLKRLSVDVNNICITLDFNFLEGENEFQMFAGSKATDTYADFFANYLAVFFNDRGYNVIEENSKAGYLYMHFKKDK